MIDGSPASREISLGSEVCLSDSATATQLCRRFHQYAHCVCRCPDACRLFRTSPVACLCCFSSNLCSETLLWTPEHCNLYIHTDFLIKIFTNGVKVGAFASCSVKIHVIFSVLFERRKVDKKKQTYMKTETCKCHSRVFWVFLLPNIVIIDHYFEPYRFKVGSFVETRVYNMCYAHSWPTMWAVGPIISRSFYTVFRKKHTPIFFHISMNNK